MTSLWIALGVLHVTSIGFALIVLMRLYHYIKRYRFDESKYTLLFGFIHLHWIAGAYVMLVLGWVAVSLLIFTRI
ncbi:hypothetical protein HYW83_01450 [Candidatus Peregrinibacteria bacterium]|nr:hypothetical protein [Candidatus Peregrinibacteria bacterium]